MSSWATVLQEAQLNGLAVLCGGDALSSGRPRSQGWRAQSSTQREALGDSWRRTTSRGQLLDLNCLTLGNMYKSCVVLPLSHTQSCIHRPRHASEEHLGGLVLVVVVDGVVPEDGLVTIAPREVAGADVLVRVFDTLLKRGHVAPVFPMLVPQHVGVGRREAESGDAGTGKVC